MHLENNLKNAYVDRAEASSVSGSHVLVQALDSICTTKVTEFLVHVMRSRPRIITEPDTKVLDFQRFLFMNLQHAEARKKRKN